MTGSLDLTLLSGALSGARFGHRIFHFSSADSTNDRALDLMEAGEPEGTLVIAEGQTRGRGRRERSWHSPRGLGIYATLILRPPLPPHHVPLVSFAAAVGAANAVRDSYPGRVSLKWPNDLLLEGKKMGGLLSEARGEGPVAGVVVGLGLNVNQTEAEFPEDLRGFVTSLRLVTGRLWDRSRLLKEILLRWEEEYEGLVQRGPEGLLQRFGELSELRKGAPLQIDPGDGPIRGRFAGFGPAGELLLETSKGSLRPFTFGEVGRMREV